MKSILQELREPLTKQEKILIITYSDFFNTDSLLDTKIPRNNMKHKVKTLMMEHICKECGNSYMKTTHNRIFCSRKCNTKSYNRNRDPDSYLIGNDDFQDDSALVEEMFGRLILCPKCEKPLSSFWARKRRNTKRGEDKDRYRCLRCGYDFTLRGLGFRIQHPESQIKKFIDLIETGLNPNQIAKRKVLPISTMTAYRWRSRFTK